MARHAAHEARSHNNSAEDARPTQFGGVPGAEGIGSSTNDGNGIVASASDLTKTYGTHDAVVTALDHVSVDFERGKMTAIMGPSGSGKSTLMHCMAGLDTPDSGTVLVESLEVSSMTQKQLTKLRREQIGFIFQSFNLIPTLSAEENIVLPLEISKKKIDRDWFNHIVDVVGLQSRLTHRPSQLSGGQQQRVACARAMMSRPSVIFADEPTGNLDSKSSGEVLGFLKSSVQRYGQSIVMVTHDPRAASYADRVLVLADGRITNDMRQPTYDEILAVFAEEGADDHDADRSDGGMAEMDEGVRDEESTEAAAPVDFPEDGNNGDETGLKL
ncbi:ABC transporter ATP-binding protein [Bifidobacterium sp.]|uniref:ABC transporter ATP-binding protein n=1 Tax=Bifidobacterium sp. TaxID=41200 RepID=UPI0039E85335